jgi:tetratricopeptide (TPR) repeat protein
MRSFVAVAWLTISTAALAQLPVATAPRAAPVARLIDPRNPPTDQKAAKSDGDTDAEPDAGDAESTDSASNDSTSPSVDEVSPDDAGGQSAPRGNGTAAAPRLTKPAVEAAPTSGRTLEGIAPGDDEAPIPPDLSQSGKLERGDISSDSTASSTSAGRRAVRLDPVSFQDIQPGVATVEQLDTKWGAPARDEVKAGNGRRVYHTEPFDHVEVFLEQGKVVSIVVHLAETSAPDDVAARFVPNATGSVEVLDDRGQAIGLAYPERGVLLAFNAQSKQVSQILFDPIEYESFMLRAERHQHHQPQQSLADLEFVLEKHAKHGPALALAAKIYHQAGQLTDAATQIDAALGTEPTNPAFLLLKAEILAESGDFTSARQTCQTVLKQTKLAPELRAEALSLMGDYLANGPQRDYRRAIEHHLAAIRTAQPLAESARAATRRAAKQVLVEAHLGVAGDIAWGNWQQKDKVVPKWLVQAHQAAEDLIDREGGDEIVHLLVLRRALAASAGTQGKLDPVTWTKESITTARRLIDASDDAWRRCRIEWELGLALYDALQADQARGYHDHALSNSSLVVKYLESALKQRQETPHGAYLLGRLYFRVGAIHAIELSDHRTAINWFQKGIPLLERPLPTTALSDVGRLGESFVSMGISYWEVGRRDEALRLTQYGVALVTQGVKDRVIDEESLSVPYSNLAFMHRELGNGRQAEGYEAMATRADGRRRQ